MATHELGGVSQDLETSAKEHGATSWKAQLLPPSRSLLSHVEQLTLADLTATWTSILHITQTSFIKTIGGTWSGEAVESRTLATSYFVLDIARTDWVNNQDPEDTCEKNTSKVRQREELPALHDFSSIVIDLFRAQRELQRLQHAVNHLRARQALQERQATTADLLPARQPRHSTLEPLSDSEQTNPTEMQHHVAQPPPVHQRAKRSSESTMEPSAKKRARQHEELHRPQQSASEDFEYGSQMDVSQQSPGNVEAVSPDHGSASTNLQPVEALEEMDTTSHGAPASPTPGDLGMLSSSTAWPAPLPASRTPDGAEGRRQSLYDELQSLSDDAYYLRLHRFKLEAERELKLHDPFQTFHPFAATLDAKIDKIMDDIRESFKRSELDLSGREWWTWVVMEISIERRRIQTHENRKA